MDISLLYQAIKEGKLYRVVSQKTENDKTYLSFKRHDSVFVFICTPPKSEEEAGSYKLLKDKEKARIGTIRAMWSDYQAQVAKTL